MSIELYAGLGILVVLMVALMVALVALGVFIGQKSRIGEVLVSVIILVLTATTAFTTYTVLKNQEISDMLDKVRAFDQKPIGGDGSRRPDHPTGG